MRIGVAFPQTEISADPGAAKAFAQAAEDLGYVHIMTFEHVLGIDLQRHPEWRVEAAQGQQLGIHSMFHEPFVLFGYLAGLTTHIGFVTGIVALPQPQTALVAKQAADVDVLCQGRLRLGVGLGWMPLEFEALNETFTNRASRLEEQVTVLRAFFTQESVTFHGRWHTIDAMGINPLPVQRPIPIWLGGHVDASLRRVVAVGDGWFPLMSPEEARPMIEQLHEYAREAQRDPASIGLETVLFVAGQSPDEWVQVAQAWHDLGADYLTISTVAAGFTSAQQHIDAIRQVKDVLSSAGIDRGSGP